MPRPISAPRFGAALDFARTAVWDAVIPRRDLLRSRIYWRDRGMALLGQPPVPMVQSFRQFLQHVHPDDRAALTRTMQEAVDVAGSYEITYRVLWPDASVHWLMARAEIVAPQRGPWRSLGMVTDVTARKQAELALAQQKELAEVTLGSIGEGVITTDAHGVVQWMNRVAEQVSGWSNQDLRGGVGISQLFKVVNEATGSPVENVAMKCLRLDQTVALPATAVLINRSGKKVPIEDAAAPIRAGDGSVLGTVIVFRDVSHERALRHELSWHAAHDPLTGLINRRLFEEHVATALAGAKQEGCQSALMFLDLDRFKIVNDTCGHVAGDVLLKVLAAVLHGHMREADILARTGGDEFGALLLKCPLDQALLLAEKLRDAVRGFRFVWEGRTFDIGVSIGLLMIDQNSPSLSALLSAADQACYAAKQLGRNRVHLYREADTTVARQHGETLWVPRLQEALEHGRFVLYTQPIVSLGAGVGTVASAHLEVLLRLRSGSADGDGALILPGAFIPAAERYDIMVPIDRWVIDSVCRWLRDSSAAPSRTAGGTQRPRYSINLSGASLNASDTCDFIAAAITRYGVDATRICFEITETEAIGNLDSASTLMRQISKLGCTFALDDFGSGFSSFAYLKLLPVSYLKIDGMFIRDITANRINRALATAINEVGHVMGMQTIAEYVESQAILAEVRALGIDFAQGHAVGNTQPLVPA